MADQDELIQQFSAVSGADADRAKFFLEAAAWNVSTALSSFFEEGGEDNMEQDPQADVAAEGVPRPQPVASIVPPAAVGGAAPPRWLTDNSDDEDESEEEGEAFYAGGSQHSGQQVLGPPKKKKKDVVARLFKAAKEHGAEVVEGRGGPGRSSKKTSFSGTSYRLGETPEDTQVIQDPSASSSRPAKPVELKLWSTGFTVDDGPLRDYQDRDNMRFIADIKSGRIPPELLKASGGKEVAINMADHHHEDYAEPKRSRVAFSGSGQTLGSPAPSVVGQVTHVAGPGGSLHKPAPAATADADPKAQEEEAKKLLSVDTAQPTTNVQIRLMDGSRLVVRANQSHTVGHLRTYLVTARPEYAAQEFALMTTFPHAELADDTQSLVQANLLSAAIVAKTK